MTTATDRMLEFLQGVPGLADYIPVRGHWFERDAEAAGRYLVLINGGGRQSAATARVKPYRILLIGPRNGRALVGQIEADAEAALQAVCESLAGWRVLGDTVGPGYTTDFRPWYEINLESVE